MLQEKQTYTFRVIRLITLPDGSQNWVLTHTGVDRYMLPAEYYADYQIKEGLALRCRVDKINCTGRIFLEPEHPWYREGERYLFRYQGSETQHDRLGNAFSKLHFQGINGENQYHITPQEPPDLKPGEIAGVEIRRIRKGVLEFELQTAINNTVIAAGNWYTFTVQEKRKDGSLLIAGPGGITTLLESAWYTSYGLLPGSSFRGEVRGWSASGDLLVEPEHPVYKPGDIHPFMVTRTEVAENDHGNPYLVAVVTDCFGHEIKVLMPFTEQTTHHNIPSVACRVERLKKGRPVLRIAVGVTDQQRPA